MNVYLMPFEFQMMSYHYRQLIDFLDWEVDLAQHIILAPSLNKHRKPVKQGHGYVGYRAQRDNLLYVDEKGTC